MTGSFARGGLRFLYPENWTLEEAPTDDGWSVTVQSQETGFMLLTVYPERPAVAEILDAALATLRQEYPELESEDASEKIAGHMARGCDFQFFSLDLTNSGWLRCFRTPSATILILCQVNDLELERVEPVFRAMRKSLTTE